MSGAGPETATLDFRPTLRQRRIRTLAAILIVLVMTMVFVGLRHPFFRSVGSAQVRDLARQAIMSRREGRVPAPVAERARRAVTVHLALIAAYWSLCFAFSAVLVVLAWMDVREIRRRLMEAHSRALDRLAERAARPHGDGRHPPPL